jgi:hypothetical protein
MKIMLLICLVGTITGLSRRARSDRRNAGGT